LIIIMYLNRDLANLLLADYICGTQDTDAGLITSQEWHKILHLDRRRALLALAHAVVAHNHDGTRQTHRNRERALVLSNAYHFAIAGNTVLIPKDCPVHLVNGSFQLAPSAYTAIAQSIPATDPEPAPHVQEIGPGLRQDYLADMSIIEEAERAWDRLQRVVAGLRPCNDERAQRQLEAQMNELD
jgi:hypothetical protein